MHDDGIPSTSGAVANDPWEQCARAARDGDEDALAQLFRRYARMVHRLAAGRLGNDWHAAEDVTSEVFMKVTRTIGTYRSEKVGGIAAWIATITKNTCYDRYAKASHKAEMPVADCLALDRPTSDLSPHEQAEQHQMAREVAAALRKIKPEQAECLKLRFYLGYTTAEVAQIMDRSEGAVKQLQLRGLKAVSQHLPNLAALRNPTTASPVTTTTDAAAAAVQD